MQIIEHYAPFLQFARVPVAGTLEITCIWWGSPHELPMENATPLSLSNIRSPRKLQNIRKPGCPWQDMAAHGRPQSNVALFKPSSNVGTWRAWGPRKDAQGAAQGLRKGLRKVCFFRFRFSLVRFSVPLLSLHSLLEQSNLNKAGLTRPGGL